MTVPSSFGLGDWNLPIIKMHESNDLNKVRIKGGGGTNMGAGIEEALKIRPRTNIIVTLTDGATPWPDKKPIGSVIYLAILTTKSFESHVPRWMTTVVMENR